jgi:CRP-like cAMP-binding protein
MAHCPLHLSARVTERGLCSRRRCRRKEALSGPSRSPIGAQPLAGNLTVGGPCSTSAEARTDGFGREGMIGLPFLFGDDRSATEIIVQGAGRGLRLDVGAFRQVMSENPALHARLLRYALAFQAQVSQTAVCNARHNVEERLARWLLMAHDRANGKIFVMTQEFMSVMLGIRRQGVTVAAGALQRAGLVRYQRGAIEIIDRSGLEAPSCECHAAIRHEFERLLGTAC